jgi:predicted hydrolase (HD superfamily)
MLTKQKALSLIKNSSKYKHSLIVAEVMMVLAGFFDCRKEEWELVGLLHDFDYDLVEDVNQHVI